MPRPSTGNYPPNWEEIALQVKNEAGWKCVRCHEPHDIPSGYMLTVHHLDLNKSNCEWWNLAALCQRCHLQIQHKVIMERPYMFEHTPNGSNPTRRDITLTATAFSTTKHS